MILPSLILILIVGGIASWVVARRSEVVARWIAVASVLADLFMCFGIWVAHLGQPQSTPERWFVECNFAWIPQFGIRIHLAIDGLSLALLLLTYFLGISAGLSSWTEIRRRVGFFHFNLLWVLAGITGVFLAVDLFVFYLFWELMLVPMYFLIGIWGHERRIYAATKFFLFTQLSGLLMLIAIIALAVLHQQSTGVFTFDYEQLIETTLSSRAARLLMLGFLVAFAVKLPAFPFHTWLPDAHTEAPTAGSVILAGVLLKMGTYGFLRFSVPMFPDATNQYRNFMIILSLIGIIYGALVCMMQKDMKKLIAYSSVSHMGFCTLGIFALTPLGLTGSIIQQINHGISTGALFLIVGVLYERRHTRLISEFGGLATPMPNFAAVYLIVTLSSLGMPLLNGFIGEFTILRGVFEVRWQYA